MPASVPCSCRIQAGGTSRRTTDRGHLHTTVANPATRVAAIKAGDIDMMYEVPPADTESLKKEKPTSVLEGPETRVVFLLDTERPVCARKSKRQGQKTF